MPDHFFLAVLTAVLDAQPRQLLHQPRLVLIAIGKNVQLIILPELVHVLKEKERENYSLCSKCVKDGIKNTQYKCFWMFDVFFFSFSTFFLGSETKRAAYGGRSLWLWLLVTRSVGGARERVRVMGGEGASASSFFLFLFPFFSVIVVDGAPLSSWHSVVADGTPLSSFLFPFSSVVDDGGGKKVTTLSSRRTT